MSSAERRRNGSRPSCEPCRKAKMKCDHQKPVCAPCQRRGRELRCFYHPAPLTKPRASKTFGSNSSTFTRTTIQPSDSAGSINIKDDNSQLVDPSTTTIPTGGIKKAHAWSFIYNEKPDTGLPSQPLVLDNQTDREEHLAALGEILCQLKCFSLIEKLVDEYFSFSQAAIVPHPIVRRLFAMLKSSLLSSEQGEDGLQAKNIFRDVSTLATSLLRSASNGVTITPFLDLEAFCALFSGANLRMETLGLFYAIAARSYLYGSRREDKTLDGFVRQLIRCSNLCLRLSHELAAQHTNDLIVWLGIENVQLTSLLEGHGSLGAWRRLGDLTTDVYALGMHREEAYSEDKIPFYLAEFRRRTFGFVYYLDKAFSSLFLQPPRLSSRYTNCRQFLDLSDEEAIAATTQGLDKLQQKLTVDGWNTDGCYRATTWARLRYRWSELEHEMIDMEFGSPQTTDEQKLRELSRMCQHDWDSLPGHLRYDPDCWTSNLPPGTCLMLAKVYLSYLQLRMQVYKLLSRVEGNSPSTQPELLEVSAKMLETSVQIANVRNREGYFPYPVDLTSHVLHFGLPAAAILTMALKDVKRDSFQSLPPSINRTLLIRNISVLISHAESLYAQDETESTDQASYRQASKVLSRRLDQILEGIFVVPTTPIPPNLAAGQEGLESSSTQHCSNPSPLAPMNTEAVDLGAYDDFDFEKWATNAVFDLETTNHNWNMF